MEARFGRRTILLLLAVLVLMSIGLRYPMVEHERFQTDSYFIHDLAKSISDYGQARWTLSPYSYSGNFPLSYPSGTPFMIAEVSILTGTSIEFSILLVDMFMGILLCLGVFMMARSLLQKDQFVILATLLTILGPRFLDTTYWNASARGPMIVLAVLTVFVLFRAEQMGQRRLYIIGLLLILGGFVTHHMAVLLFLFGIAYIVALLQARYIVPGARSHRRAWAALFNGVLGLSVLLAASLLYDQWRELVVLGSGEDAIFTSGPEPLVVLLNVGVSYVHQIGFVLLFAVFGIAYVLKESRLSAMYLYPLALLLMFLPILSRSIYVSMLLAPFVSVLGVYWISREISRPSRKKVIGVLVVLLAVVSVVLPLWSVQRWNGITYTGDYTVEVSPDVFTDGSYLNYNYAGQYTISNSNILRMKLAATTDAILPGSGVQRLINGELTADDVLSNSVRTKADFPLSLYSWFEYTDRPDVDFLLYALMVQGVSFAKMQSEISSDAGDYLLSHRNLVVAIDNDHSTSYVDNYHVYSSVFASELKSATWITHSGSQTSSSEWSSYLIYCSGQMSYYLAELPI